MAKKKMARKFVNGTAKKRGSQGKVPATRDQIQREFATLNDDELLAYVARHFCDGYPPSEIAKMLKTSKDAKWLRDPKSEVSREKITRLVLYAASQGWLHFRPPHDSRLADRIKSDFDMPGSNIRIVPTDSIDDLARHASELLLEMARVTNYRKVATECHIGWGGGAVARKCARYVGDMILHSDYGVVSRKFSTLYMHAMVSGFSVADRTHDITVDEPTSEPGSFFAYLAEDPGLREVVRCIGFHAPGLVRLDEYNNMKKRWPIDVQRAFQQRESIDIVIASAAHWPCSQLHAAYELADPGHLKKLKEEAYFGDLLWEEISQKRTPWAADDQRQIRAMTLFSLAEVQERIEKHNLRVLLVIGRCPNQDCHERHRSRTEVLRRILELDLATDLVCDSRTAIDLLQSKRVAD